MLEPAEVVGIEEQLTVPSRNHPQLVDIWIAIRRSAAGLDWESEFIALAHRENAKLSAAGALQVIPFTERSGWVVARGVDQRTIPPAAVEVLVRAVVAEANANLAASRAPRRAPVLTAAQDSWKERVRTVLASGGGLSRALWPQPTRNAEVDIASNG